jgi:pyruvyltransferase
MRPIFRVPRRITEKMIRAARSDGGVISHSLRLLIGQRADWVPAFWFTGTANLGDVLAPVIVRAILGREPLLVNRSYKGKLVSTGSVLSAAQPGDQVWGSGLLLPEKFDGRGVRFLAVRGPRTRSLITGEVPERYGDPAMLLPSIYMPPSVGKRFEIGVIAHYRDNVDQLRKDNAVLWIDVQHMNWRATIEKINQCELVVSSSLHGLILAEAYGVPAVWVKADGPIKGGAFKFHDYYEGTDRQPPVAAQWKWGFSAIAARASHPPKVDVRHLLEAAAELA